MRLPWLGQPLAERDVIRLRRSAAEPLEPASARPYVAVASREGVLVNQHLGEAERLFIYELSSDGPRLVETRATPTAGGGRDRWLALGSKLSDCRAVLTSGAGSSPRDALSACGVQVLIADAMIDEALETVFGGGALRAPFRETRCGDGCTGSGQGCA